MPVFSGTGAGGERTEGQGRRGGWQELTQVQGLGCRVKRHALHSDHSQGSKGVYVTEGTTRFVLEKCHPAFWVEIPWRGDPWTR